MVRMKLETVLSDVSGELEAGIAEAEAELARLDARREDLLALIARAKAALGNQAPVEGRVNNKRGLTLHEAIVRVLEERGNGWMRARELCDEINGRGLYSKRDGTPVEVNQVHARVNNYPQLFEKNASLVRVRGDKS